MICEREKIQTKIDNLVINVGTLRYIYVEDVEKIVDEICTKRDARQICKNCEYWYPTSNNYYCHLYNRHKFFHQSCDEFEFKRSK